jgi:DNA mismatch endonuclease (patch repair protein)
MQAVKGRDTKPEMTVRRLVHSMGYRYRLHKRTLPGVPDLVFPSKKKLIFIHGCFWHGHDCPRGSRRPKENADYWVNKITRNQERDTKTQETLQVMGWNVLIIWECQIKDRASLTDTLARFLSSPAKSA